MKMAMSKHDQDLLKRFEKDLLETLDIKYLIPYLTAGETAEGETKLLTEDEVDRLSNNPTGTRQTTAKDFLSILKTKGRGALSLFIKALSMEKEHRGHKCLHDMFLEEVEGGTTCTDNPKEATSLHQILFPLEQSTNTLQRESLVLSTSQMYATNFADTSTSRSTSSASKLVSHTRSNSLLTSQKSSTTSLRSGGSSGNISTTCSSAIIETLVQEQTGMHMMCILNEKLDEIKKDVKDVKGLVKSTSSFGFPTESCSNSNESLIVRKKKRSYSVDSGVPIRSTIMMQNSGIHTTELTQGETSHPMAAIQRPSDDDTSNLSAPESAVIPPTSFYLPPIIREDQVLFIPCEKTHKAQNENIVHIYNLQSNQWDKKEIQNLLNPNDVGFCLVYMGCVAILCLKSVANRSAVVEIYKLKEMVSWEPIPLVRGTLKPIDLDNCQCVQSSRNIAVLSICQSSLMIFVHRSTFQWPWTSVSLTLPDVDTNYKLQSCTITLHTLYCSLLCTKSKSQQTVMIYKVNLERAIENKEVQHLELVHTYASFVQCHLLMISSDKAMMVNIVTNSSSRSYNTLELCSLNDYSVKLYQKDFMFGSKLLSVSSVHTTTCKNNALIVYFDTVSQRCYLEVIPLKQ